MNRIIFHVDMDAFFASCELRRSPELKGKSVIIGADPKEGEGRGVVMTCSYEARKYKIKSGMPISRAYKLCSNGVYLRPNMAYYKEISERVMIILRAYADKNEEITDASEKSRFHARIEKFEQWGLDEAFLDVTETVLNYSDPTELAQKIKNEINKKLQLTCSIGIGPNKQVAKIASDYQKPDAITYIQPNQVHSFLGPLSVDKIIGIGPKTKKVLNQKLNIHTIADLASYSAEKLNKKFGKLGVYLYNAARGIDNSHIRQKYKRKSLGAEVTFSEDVKNFNILYKNLRILVDKLHESLIKKKYLYRVVVIKIRFSNFNTYTRQQKLKTPTNDKTMALQVGEKLLKEFESNPKKVRLLGFRFTEIFKAKYVQKTLFDFI
ncbi:MAG: DNA polymerase IV [Promethearchaeota archaeon]